MILAKMLQSGTVLQFWFFLVFFCSLFKVPIYSIYHFSVSDLVASIGEKAYRKQS